MKPIHITPDWVVSADLHIGHDKDFIWQDRGFKSPEEHHEFIFNSLENELKYNCVLVLGDLMFRTKQQLRDRLSSIINHNRFFCIPGNHDDEYIQKKVRSDGIFRDIVTLQVESRSIVISHYPMSEWPGAFHRAYHLHGHTHGNIPYSDRPNRRIVNGRMDVSVDCLMSIFKKPFVSIGTLLDYIDKRDAEVQL